MTTSEIGLVGLGTMGSMLTLNIAEKGFDIAVWNKEQEIVGPFMQAAGELAEHITPTRTYEELAAAIKKPRAIILMVPAFAVDDVLKNLGPHLDRDDLIIDAGNSDFHDTDRRTRAGEKTGPRFMGIGISGGEDGARHGPSIMAGGTKRDWDQVSNILKAISAHYDGTPCAVRMGEGGAGHFVKAVHNGIEYADMQMIAEVYGVMRDGMGMDAPAISEAFATWNRGVLKSYLIETASEVAGVTDAATGGPILDVIVDRAGQKGTGRWTAQAALDLGAPVPVIEAAIMARNTSSRLDARKAGEAIFGAAPTRLEGDAITLDILEHAMIAGKILCYAQGFDLLVEAGEEYGWALPLPDIAKDWRAGCIIRSAMLDDMATALGEHPDENLMRAPFFADLLKGNHMALRTVVAEAARAGLPVPALAAGLSWFDIMRTGRSTANMIQGLRDFFGSHGFARLDDGTEMQHGPWKMKVG